MLLTQSSITQQRGLSIWNLSVTPRCLFDNVKYELYFQSNPLLINNFQNDRNVSYISAWVVNYNVRILGMSYFHSVTLWLVIRIIYWIKSFNVHIIYLCTHWGAERKVLNYHNIIQVDKNINFNQQTNNIINS